MAIVDLQELSKAVQSEGECVGEQRQHVWKRRETESGEDKATIKQNRRKQLRRELLSFFFRFISRYLLDACFAGRLCKDINCVYTTSVFYYDDGCK
jgi:hypothetical protein